MKIGIIGMGIVGGNTAKVFSQAHEIFPYDKYKEPYNKKEDLENIVRNAEIVFICVPTPMRASGKIDCSIIYDSLNYIRDSCYSLNKKTKDILVIMRSTMVSGTCDKLAGEYGFRFAVNPEFLREKYALEDMKNSKRVILGANSYKDRELLMKIYKPLFPDANYIVTNRKTAEMIKSVANVFLASQVGIANEIYQICQKADVSYGEVKNAILTDERVGRNIDVPGHDGDFGFGGKCFPKDLNAFINFAKEKGYNPKVLKEIWNLNKKVRKKHDWHDILGATSKNKHKT